MISSPQLAVQPFILTGLTSIREAVHFVWSLPVSVLITGADNPELIKGKIELAKNFTEMSEEKRNELIDKVADLADGKVEDFKKPMS